MHQKIIFLRSKTLLVIIFSPPEIGHACLLIDANDFYISVNVAVVLQLCSSVSVKRMRHAGPHATQRDGEVSKAGFTRACATLGAPWCIRYDVARTGARHANATSTEPNHTVEVY